MREVKKELLKTIVFSVLLFCVSYILARPLKLTGPLESKTEGGGPGGGGPGGGGPGGGGPGASVPSRACVMEYSDLFEKIAGGNDICRSSILLNLIHRLQPLKDKMLNGDDFQRIVQKTIDSLTKKNNSEIPPLPTFGPERSAQSLIEDLKRIEANFTYLGRAKFRILNTLGYLLVLVKGEFSTRRTKESNSRAQGLPGNMQGLPGNMLDRGGVPPSEKEKVYAK